MSRPVDPVGPATVLWWPAPPPDGRFGVAGGVMIDSEEEVESRFSFLVVSLPLLLVLFSRWCVWMRELLASGEADRGIEATG